MNTDQITIFNGHSGDSFKVGRHYFVTLDELKKFCSNQFNIPLPQLFLISPFGSKLKITYLENTDEIYVFDRNLFSIYNDDNSIQTYIKKNYLHSIDDLIQPITSPLEDINLQRIIENRNQRQLISLLTTNLGWVSAIESDSSLYLKRIDEINKKLLVIIKSLKVASQYIEIYCNDIKRQFDNSMDFIIILQKNSLNLIWKDHLKKLTNIQTLENQPLSKLLNFDELNNIAHESIKLNEIINDELLIHKSNLEKSKKFRLEVDNELNILEVETTKILKMTDSEEILKELKKLSNKVQKDIQLLLGNTINSIDDLDVDIILESIQLHKSEYCKKIYMFSAVLYSNIKSFYELSHKIQIQTSNFLCKLSKAQAEMVILKESLKEINHKSEEIQSLEFQLTHTIDLPLLYGLYLIESIRRNEWISHVKKLVSTTNENFAIFREKEIKIRSQWVKNYGEILKILLKDDISSFISTNLLNVDLNINEDKSIKPQIITINYTKENVMNYIEQLKNNGVSNEITNLLTKSIDDIPIKISKIKFDDIRLDATSDENQQSLVKGYKSRIKKLENLLHQEQFKAFHQWPSPDSRFQALSRRSTIYDNKQEISIVPQTSSATSLGNNAEITPEFLKLQNDNLELSKDLKNVKTQMELTNDELKILRQSLSLKDFENQQLLKSIEELTDNNLIELNKVKLELTKENVSKTQLEDKIEVQIKELEALKKVNEEYEKINFELNESKIKFESDNLKKNKKNDDLLEEISQLNEELETFKTQTTSLQSQSKSQTNQIMELKELLKEKDSIIESQSNQIVHFQSEITGLNETISIKDNKLEDWSEDYDRLKSMKNDLLENMSNRESEISKEKTAHHEEIENLKSKVEELERSKIENNVYDLQGSDQSQTIFQLTIIINSLIIKSRDLSEILFQFYEIFYASLKSVGLLPVKTHDNEIKIIRVKGLKRLDETSTIEIPNGYSKDLLEDVKRDLLWTELPDSTLISGLNETDGKNLSNSESLESICQNLIANYNLTTFEDRYINFAKSITNLNQLYYTSLSKRFEDVEKLAKKERKEVKRLKETKISIRDFKEDDLALFLPAKNNNIDSTNGIQWAAFNNTGDLNFLKKKNEIMDKTLNSKQWFIGKILKIDKVDDKEYLIETKEVVLNF